MKTTIQSANNGALFLITKTVNGKDVVETADAMLSVDDKHVAQSLATTAKNAGFQRTIFQSALASIFGQKTLDGYRGTGDKKTGKTSKEFKSSIRDAESVYFKSLVDNKLLTLPKSDNVEKTFQEFCTSIREDKNYSNIKSTVSKYFAFVGASCKTESGFLVPHAVMLAQIANVMEIETDSTFAGKCKALRETLGQITLEDKDATNSIQILLDMVSTVQGVIKYHAELATNAAQKVAPIPEATRHVINMAEQQAKALEEQARLLQEARDRASAHPELVKPEQVAEAKPLSKGQQKRRAARMPAIVKENATV